MKNIENRNAINDMAAETVTGGDLPTIFDPGRALAMILKTSASAEAKGPYPPLGRPLPFPQDRRGHKATL